MSRAHDLFRPNGLKLLLAATLLVPVFFAFVLINGFPYPDIIFPAAVTIGISYAAACVVDEAVQSRPVKIAIASVAALVSIILGCVLVRGMTMICEPVHEPGGMVCDPVHVPEPATIAPTQTVTMAPAVVTPAPPHPATPMIFDPVHEPGDSGPGYGILSGTTTGIVAQKLDEVLKKL